MSETLEIFSITDEDNGCIQGIAAFKTHKQIIYELQNEKKTRNFLLHNSVVRERLKILTFLKLIVIAHFNGNDVVNDQQSRSYSQSILQTI